MLAMLLALFSVKIYFASGLLVILGIVGLPVALLIVFRPAFGVKLLVFLVYVMGTLIMLFPSLPIGIVIDLFILLLTLGRVLQDLNDKKFRLFKAPLVFSLALWVLWHLIELFNPIAASRVAWFYVVRPGIGYIMLFFVTYGLIKTKKDVKQMVYLCWGLSVLSAIWGIISVGQNYFDFEMRYLVAQDALKLVFIAGRYRAFGTMATPAQFGVITAQMGILAIVLLSAKYKWYQKLVFLVGIGVLFYGMAISGTRTGVVMIPVGAIFVVLLARNVKVYILTLIGGAFFAVLMVLPIQNYHVRRMQTAFSPEKDASYEVRMKNRERIKPFIYSHPMGGGLGTTGVWGKRFSPNTMLANFPPDSGYMRIAVEMGWVGLIIYLILWASITIKAMLGGWKVKDKEMKVIVAAIIASMLPLSVAEYAQDIIGKLPSNLLFWVWIGILFKAIKIGQETNDDDERILEGQQEPENAN
ncbi:hypothetical protein GCM10023331_27750 [Algivirga pacifica]|uniref:O-antigen ligase-related domain-containing protein n=2 Tax=Algivirga pacifica TaxID=1162670 RepID=A0ABP9DHL4_9BACT